jgi:hypothetical protein
VQPHPPCQRWTVSDGRRDSFFNTVFKRTGGSDHVTFSCGAGGNLSSSRSASNASKIRTNCPLDIKILKPLDYLYSSKADSIVRLRSSLFYRSPKASFPPTNQQPSNTPPKVIIKIPSRFSSNLLDGVKACIGPQITKENLLSPVQRHDCLTPRAWDRGHGT